MLKIQKISANHTPKYNIEWEGEGGGIYCVKISLLEDNNRIIGKLGGVPRTFGQDCLNEKEEKNRILTTQN